MPQANTKPATVTWLQRINSPGKPHNILVTYIKRYIKEKLMINYIMWSGLVNNNLQLWIRRQMEWVREGGVWHSKSNPAPRQSSRSAGRDAVRQQCTEFSPPQGSRHTQQKHAHQGVILWSECKTGQQSPAWNWI